MMRMEGPRWSAVDDTTADILTLVRDEGHPSADYEWSKYLRCLRHAADDEGIIRPNVLRPLVRGVIAPKRIGAFTSSAIAKGLVAYTGDYEITDPDPTGRNGGKPARIMRWQGVASEQEAAS